MARTKAAGIVAAALVAGSCAGPTDAPVTPGPDEDGSGRVAIAIDVGLAVGQEVRVNSVLRLGVAGVPTDSRCPSSVACFSAGDAAVEVRHAVGTGALLLDTLHTNVGPRAVTVEGFRITLVTVRPYPTDLTPIPLAEYQAQLRIERAP